MNRKVILRVIFRGVLNDYYFSDILGNKYPFFIAKCKILCYFALKIGIYYPICAVKGKQLHLTR